MKTHDAISRASGHRAWYALAGLALWASLTVLPAEASAQCLDGEENHHADAIEREKIGPATRAQIEEVRAATARFADVEAAISAGFRHGGISTPTMGEHWVSPRRVFDGEIRLDEPEGLMYADIEGKKTLVGAFYLLVQPKDDPVPEGFAGRADRWHRHVRGEPSGFDFTGDDVAPSGTPGLTMLHLWFVPAQEGPFTDHNYWLAFRAAGLPTPRADHPAHGRLVAETAMALAEVGDNWSFAERATRQAGSSERARLTELRQAIRERVSELGKALESGDDDTAIDAMRAMATAWREIYRIERKALEGRVGLVFEHGVCNMLDGHTM